MAWLDIQSVCRVVCRGANEKAKPRTQLKKVGQRTGAVYRILHRIGALDGLSREATANL